MKRLIDPYEATPRVFHDRIEQTLYILKQAESSHRTIRKLTFTVALMTLLVGTALALESFGVFRFITERYKRPIDQAAIVQSCNSELLSASLRDSYWDGEMLAISLSVQPQKANTALSIVTDVGEDGETFDHIWWKGEMLPFDVWRDGRTTIELGLPPSQRMCLAGSKAGIGCRTRLAKRC